VGSSRGRVKSTESLRASTSASLDLVEARNSEIRELTPISLASNVLPERRARHHRPRRPRAAPQWTVVAEVCGTKRFAKPIEAGPSCATTRDSSRALKTALVTCTAWRRVSPGDR